MAFALSHFGRLCEFLLLFFFLARQNFWFFIDDGDKNWVQMIAGWRFG